ncbi:MAG: arginine--tRNA ligase [bacterium]
MINDLKTKINSSLSALFERVFDIKIDNFNLSMPPDLSLGDFSVECFSLSIELKISPAQIATSIANSFAQDDLIEKVSAAGPYLNIMLKDQQFFSLILGNILDLGKDFGDTITNRGEKIMVEYMSPNTNKPLHLGHLRNGALGMAVAKILQSTGAEVIKANLVNDRGVHICKSMLAWQKWGENSTPESWGMKGDHFVGHWYVKFAQELEGDPSLEDQAQEMLQKWETNDPEIIDLWEKMNSWVLGGFAETYKSLNFQFDKQYFESNTYKLGKQQVFDGVERGIFSHGDREAIVASLPEKEFGVEKNGEQKKVTLIRPDGTSVYMTQDLETAKLKFDENNLTESIYVVGSEQEYHFKVLFKLLEMLGFAWAKKSFHLSYGMVYLPDGKMKSREGKVIDADDLVMEMRNLAKKEILSRELNQDLVETELDKRANAVADAAIKYYLLQFASKQDIHFDPKASLSFEGNTGPYCLYTYARAKSILSKSGMSINNDVDYSQLGEYEERVLLSSLMNFSEALSRAAAEMSPAKVVAIVYDIAKSFNQFYHAQQVINIENINLKKARLALVEATSVVIKKGLSLLNIEVIEQM